MVVLARLVSVFRHAGQSGWLPSLLWLLLAATSHHLQKQEFPVVCDRLCVLFVSTALVIFSLVVVSVFGEARVPQAAGFFGLT